MWFAVLAMLSYDVPRQTRLPRLHPPVYQPERPKGLLEIRPVAITLDGWAFYAKAGGLVVAFGEGTKPFIYDCDPRWDGSVPFCRIGRNTVKMPGHLLTIVGVAFTTIQDAVRRARSDIERPRYRARDVIDGGRINVKALVSVLPLINIGILERGAYGNILVSL